MTLYEYIMGEAGVKKKSNFTEDDWRALGRGELDDEQVKAMLEEGYEAICGDEEAEEE